ncbi:hypothetical protein ACFFX1_11050 [Dactylosporangium sucinum]|uniref:Uncharacterized protein n=1 Tax=Dactylosporangium sucinum TaxID=1424081 RepID=A0A917TGL9_9ACTN|nr:hypothetical protein [Dactylosporangium sucinum]GGM22572.1 hypothetical protein GCM10007977_024670 [Dactylosporangium sucinum]
MSVAARIDGPVDDDRPRRAWTGRRIDSKADVARVLAAVGEAGQRRERTSTLNRVVDRAADVALTQPDAARVMPVVPELAGLLPWPGGIRRGATLSALGSASLLFTLVAEAMTQGAWTAVVGMPGLSALPAQEYGIDLERMIMVPHPGEQWAAVVAALVDGLDVVAVAAPAEVPAATARSLMARARQRRCVLISTRAWPGCDVSLEVVQRRWFGLGQGRGRLRLQEATVEAAGRGRAERPRRVSTTLPPPSIAQRVGPLPGQIPGLPITDPDRVFPSTPAAPAPRLLPKPEPDAWEQFFAGPPPGARLPRERAG